MFVINEKLRLNIGLAEMLKGGVIMDVVNAEQALIAEKAGACAVMALERVPSDIRKEGGVARMSPISKIREIMATVSIPVMAKARIGHFTEAQILEALGVDYIDESEVLTPADDEHHIAKRDFKVPFVCGARNLGEALRRIAVSAVGIATPADAALVMQLGAEAVFVGSGIFKSEDPESRAKAIVKATTYYKDPAKLLEASEDLGMAMPGLDVTKLPESELMATRGW
jgi:pyridoxal biosynthesis lyase PdxS